MAGNKTLRIERELRKSINDKMSSMKKLSPREYLHLREKYERDSQSKNEWYLKKGKDLAKPGIIFKITDKGNNYKLMSEITPTFSEISEYLNSEIEGGKKPEMIDMFSDCDIRLKGLEQEYSHNFFSIPFSVPLAERRVLAASMLVPTVGGRVKCFRGECNTAVSAKISNLIGAHRTKGTSNCRSELLYRSQMSDELKKIEERCVKRIKEISSFAEMEKEKEKWSHEEVKCDPLETHLKDVLLLQEESDEEEETETKVTIKSEPKEVKPKEEQKSGQEEFESREKELLDLITKQVGDLATGKATFLFKSPFGENYVDEDEDFNKKAEKTLSQLQDMQIKRKPEFQLTKEKMEDEIKNPKPKIPEFNPSFIPRGIKPLPSEKKKEIENGPGGRSIADRLAVANSKLKLKALENKKRESLSEETKPKASQQPKKTEPFPTEKCNCSDSDEDFMPVRRMRAAVIDQDLTNDEFMPAKKLTTEKKPSLMIEDIKQIAALK